MFDRFLVTVALGSDHDHGALISVGRAEVGAVNQLRDDVLRRREDILVGCAAFGGFAHRCHCSAVLEETSFDTNFPLTSFGSPKPSGARARLLT